MYSWKTLEWMLRGLLALLVMGWYPSSSIELSCVDTELVIIVLMK